MSTATAPDPGAAGLLAPEPARVAATATAQVAPRPGRAADPLAALLRGMAAILGSHALVGAAGLLAMPLLARNLGPASYGAWSLAATLLASLLGLDFARPLLTRLAAGRRGLARAREHAAVGALDALALGAASAAAGLVLLGSAPALLLAAIGVLHGLGSHAFARLAAQGRVGSALALRNLAWALSTLAVAGLSFATPRPEALLAPFACAACALTLAYRRLAFGRAAPRARDCARRIRSARWLASAWRRHAGDVRDLAGHCLAVGAMVVIDRALLQRVASAEALGAYCARSDLVVRLAIAGTALSSVLYPMLAARIAEEGLEAARALFLRVAALALLAWSAGVLLLMACEAPLLELLLGAGFGGADGLLALMLVGTWLHAFGFLLTAWQRARGQFAVQRRAYGRAALLTLAAGAFLVPRYGAWGAALTFLCTRSAELQLLAHEWRRAPRGTRTLRAAALPALLFAVVLAAALARIAGGGSA